MQKIWASAAVVLLVAIGVLVFLLAGALRPPRPSALDATDERLDLIRHVPAAAREIYVVTSAAGVYRKLQRSAAADAVLAPLEDSLPFPALPLLLGSNDLVVWREGRSTGFVARPDPLRRWLIRVYARLSSAPVSAVDGLVLLGAETAGTIDPSRVLQWVALARGIDGEVFLLQSEEDDSGFPPMNRPAATALRIGREELRTVSRAPADPGRMIPEAPLPVRLPGGAMISVAVAKPPEIIVTLARAFPVDVGRLLGNGGTVSIYRVDTEKLVPRIRGVVVVPDEPATREIVRELESGPLRNVPGLGTVLTERRKIAGVEVVRSRGFGYTLERARRDGELLIAFDRDSMEKVLTDTLEPVPFDEASSRWLARVRPDLVAPALEDLRRQPQLKLLAPELDRALDRLHRWAVPLAGGGPIHARGRSAGVLETVEMVVRAPK